MIKSVNRKANIIVYISLLLSITAFTFIFKTKIEELFSSVIDKGLDDNGRFESIEISEYMQQTIGTVYTAVMNEIDRLDEEDTAFAENRIK